MLSGGAREAAGRGLRRELARPLPDLTAKGPRWRSGTHKHHMFNLVFLRLLLEDCPAKLGPGESAMKSRRVADAPIAKQARGVGTADGAPRRGGRRESTIWTVTWKRGKCGAQLSRRIVHRNSSQPLPESEANVRAGRDCDWEGVYFLRRFRGSPTVIEAVGGNPTFFNPDFGFFFPTSP